MKVGEWITIFEGLEKAGATEDSELKFFSQAGVPYELARIGNNVPDIQKEEIHYKDNEGKDQTKLLFKMRIK